LADSPTTVLPSLAHTVEGDDLPSALAFAAQEHEGMQQSQYRVVMPELPFDSGVTVTPVPVPVDPPVADVAAPPVALAPPTDALPPAGAAPPAPGLPPLPEVALQVPHVTLQFPANQVCAQKPHALASAQDSLERGVSTQLPVLVAPPVPFVPPRVTPPPLLVVAPPLLVVAPPLLVVAPPLPVVAPPLLVVAPPLPVVAPPLPVVAPPLGLLAVVPPIVVAPPLPTTVLPP